MIKSDVKKVFQDVALINNTLLIATDLAGAHIVAKRLQIHHRCFGFDVNIRIFVRR
jgi:hypothetical protein